MYVKVRLKLIDAYRIFLRIAQIGPGAFQRLLLTMKYHILVFLLLVISVGVHGEQSQTEFCQTKFHTELTCVVTYGVSLDDVWSRSHIDCARACSQNFSCASFFYFQETQMCRLNEHILTNRTSSCSEPQQYAEKVMNTACSYADPSTLTTSTSTTTTTTTTPSLTPATGTTTSSTTSKFTTPGLPSEFMYMFYPYFFMNDPCSTHIDCVFLGSAYCAMSVCQCTPGYSFDWTTYTCVSGCSQYGHSYQIEQGTAFTSGYAAQFDNMYEDECLQNCTDTTIFTCLSAVYDFTGMKCYLSYKTALTEPVEPLAGNNLYHRDCLFV